MAKKKIVHIAQSAGGVLEYLYMFFKNFNNEDYENILIVSQDYEKNLKKFRNIVKEIYIVPMTREIKLKQDIKSILEVRKLLKKIKPDILYLHSSKAGAYGRIAMLFNHKTKILYNAHGWYFNADMSPKKKKIIALIEKILAIKTDKIINISKSEYDSALKYKIASEKKMCIIENGIDFKKFEGCEKYREETRKKYNIKDNEIVIGVVGRLSEQKDPMTTIKAFNEIYKENKNVRLMYVGSGDLEKEVIKYAQENNLTHLVTITGWIEDTEKYIPAFDIAILPSKWEGFGLVLIEYMVCNKPIVASNVGGIADIIKDKENGLLTEKDNYKMLYENINKLYADNNLKERIIAKNKIRRSNFDIQKIVQQNLQLFNEIIN